MEKPPEITDDKILTYIRNPNSIDLGFRLLLEKYQERLYWHIRRLVTDHEDANDVVQNCFVKVYKSIGNFQSRAKLYTWLYRIATNEAITFLNKKAKKQVSSIDEEETNLSNKLQADPFFDGNAAQVILQKALNKLPEKQKIVFNLRYFEEMSYAQMSDILETSTGALKASYHHAVKKIERYFSEVQI